jgi:pyridoxine/pyridoxamine 5'-phosphate oxidase
MSGIHSYPLPLHTRWQRDARETSPLCPRAVALAGMSIGQGHDYSRSLTGHGGERQGLQSLRATVAKATRETLQGLHVEVRLLHQTSQAAVFVHSIPDASQSQEVGNRPLDVQVFVRALHVPPVPSLRSS